MSAGTQEDLKRQNRTPLCKVFQDCGGCAYQHLAYSEELEIKQSRLEALLSPLHLPQKIHPIIASPEPYFYRHRLDITLKRTSQGLLYGFQSAGSRKMVPIESCAIAKKTVSDFLLPLKKMAQEKMPENYQTANLVVKTGDDGRVLWGGIGRRSLELQEEDYLWTKVHGKRIYYSLDTFFQANLSILPLLLKKIESLIFWNSKIFFLDLYAGVGLFGLSFADKAHRLGFIEDSVASIKLLRFNLKQHQIRNATVYEGRVEEHLRPLLKESRGLKKIALVDPPRKGLHASSLQVLSQARDIQQLFYLSCNPVSLVRDLQDFLKKGWKINTVIPFDFFPQTRHIETLIELRPRKRQEAPNSKNQILNNFQ